MNFSISRNKKADWLLIFILVVAAILRFYGFPNIPFMYDELSAWSRTNFPNFSDLINHGVKPDVHPAGVQVFIYYWRKLFGDSEASFKFPFLVMGWLSVWMVFRVGKFWFNSTVGYVSAAFMAVLQYAVMYSQEERPYASGAFLSLCMVWCWSHYFFSRGKKYPRSYLIGFVIFAALCFYNHYFSLLFAVIVGTSGLFFLSRKIIFEYFAANVAILFLFLPHLDITLEQFGVGGVGSWLSAPTFDFFWNYIDYASNFSWWLKGIALALIAASFIFSKIRSKDDPPFRLLSFLWFALPLFIGYFYSVWRNPVLQYSSLIFSFPFLLFFLFSAFKQMPAVANAIMVAAIVVIGVYSLVFTRQHYQVFYHQPVDQLTKLSIECKKNSLPSPSLILMNEPRSFVGYYLEKYHSNDSMVYWDELTWDINAFRKFLLQQNASQVICANLPSDYLLQAKEFYPYEIKNAHGLNYDFYCLSNKPSDASKSLNENIFTDSLSASSSGKRWTYDPKSFQMDSATKSMVYHMDASQQHNPSFRMNLDSAVTNNYNRLNVIVKFRNISNDSSALQVQFSQNGKIYFAQSKSLRYFIDSAKEQGTAFYSINIRDIEYFKHKPTDFRALISNKSHESFDIESMKIELQTGNPWIYGIFEPVPN